MQNNNTILIVVLVIVVAAAAYYYKHTHTASVELPGGHSLSVTTHD